MEYVLYDKVWGCINVRILDVCNVDVKQEERRKKIHLFSGSIIN